MFISFSIVLAASLLSQQSDVPSVLRQYSRPLTFYYLSPDPEIGPKMLGDLLEPANLEHAFFTKRPDVVDIIGAQLGDIARGHPKIIRKYEAAFADAPPKGRRIIIRALMNCGDDEAVKQAGAWQADPQYSDVRADLEKLSKHLKGPGPRHVRDRPAQTPDDLDLLWANFFITGEYAPISRILDVFDAPEGKSDATMVRVAKWSLGSNLQQHPKLVAIVREHAKDRPAASRKVIDELIVTVPKDAAQKKGDPKP